MAPPRRKYADKATAAVRRRWKVGDLVLAKVKGFPSWPATVSEPQKWGYPADLKKILVYFFGTQQIALCNPADVEEFTEEKKLYLLGRRRGKGSDFVRALEEIVECFEKVKKQCKATSDNLIEETTITTENNSNESLTKSVNGEASAINAKQLSSVATNDLTSLTQAAVAAADDALLEDMQLGETHSYSKFTEKRVFSTSRNDAAPSLKVGRQRTVSSRKLKVSSRIDAGAPQTSVLPYTNNIRSSVQLVTNALHDNSLRRCRRVMDSTDDSDGHILNTPDFVSGEIIKENNSESISVDSDTPSFNYGCSVDSSCRTVEERPFHEINEGESLFSDMLDFQANANVIKKKRKPSRKRHRNDIVPVAKLENIISGSEVYKTESPTHKMQVAKNYVKENGDEHLPLVKRARARMGRPSPTMAEEKRLEVSESFAVQSIEPLNCNDVGEIRKNLVDGEASLPPSKRLHRALQAMSANVAEDSERTSNTANVAEDSERTSNTLILKDRTNVCTSSSAEFSEQSIIEEAAIVSGSALVEYHTHNDSHSSALEFCVGLNREVLENDGKAPVMVSDSGKTSPCADVSNPKFYEDSLEHAQGAESANSKHLKLSPLNELLSLNDHSVETDTEHQHLQESSNPPIIGGELSELDCYPPCIMRSLDDCKVEPAESKEATESSAPDNSPKNSGSVVVEEILCASPDNEKGIQMGGSDGGGYETKKENNLCLIEDNQDSQRSELIGEDTPVSMYSNIAAPANPAKVIASDLNPTSISDDHLEDRVVPVTQSSNPSDGSDSVAKTPTHGSSMTIISASDNTSYVEKNRSGCHVHQLHPGNAELTGKSSSKHELMSSFEAIIKYLTRTKEIIGRATRIAIDCAKAGLATKVMEVLSCNLESESNPHKKVDLFFLVDSITQCSGGMKGDAGIYPSAIQEILSRLLLAAAPPGICFHENHRQCLKVLRVWLDRKILPEPIIRHHILELEFLYGSHASGSSRSCRFERPFDDPIREMEDMLVDEYGSNSSIQLPGFCMPPLLIDGDSGSDSDGENFEAVTPEHNVEKLNVETNQITAVTKRSHILEDVDGELEMEDVAPICEVEINSTSNIAQVNCTQTPHHHSGNHYTPPFATEQPKDTQLTYLPLPPPPPPLPPSGFPPAVLDSVSNVPESNLYPSFQEPRAYSCSPRVKPRFFDPVHRRLHENKDSESLLPRHMRYSNNHCPLSDQPTSHFSARASDGSHSVDNGKGFHLRPPQPALSNQFSYARDQRINSRKDVPTTARPSRFHSRDTDFYRDRDRNRVSQRDDIGEYWRPPLPSVSGRYYHVSSRMAHAPILHYGPPREPEVPYSRLSFPPRYVGRKKFSPYSPPSEGPIPVTNRGFWKQR